MRVDSSRPKSCCLYKVKSYSVLSPIASNSTQAPGMERGGHGDLLEDPHSEMYSTSSIRHSSQQVSALSFMPTSPRGVEGESFQWEMRNQCQREGRESTKRDQGFSGEGQRHRATKYNLLLMAWTEPCQGLPDVFITSGQSQFSTIPQ